MPEVLSHFLIIEIFVFAELAPVHWGTLDPQAILSAPRLCRLLDDEAVNWNVQIGY